MASVLAGDVPLRAEWATRLGLDAVPADQGLGETEVHELTEMLALENLDAYAAAVTKRSRATLDRLSLDVLDAVPDSVKGLGELAGVSEAPRRGSFGCGTASRRRSSCRGRTSGTGSTISARWSRCAIGSG